MEWKIPTLFFGSLGIQEILVVLVILLLLFGGRKIPELARGLGRGITEFKRGIHEPPEKDPEALPTETTRSNHDTKDT